MKIKNSLMVLPMIFGVAAFASPALYPMKLVIVDSIATTVQSDHGYGAQLIVFGEAQRIQPLIKV